MINKICKFCNINFNVKNSRKDKAKFCSVPCKGQHQRYYYKGSNNPKWRGGKTISKGYVLVYSPNHPNIDKDGYVREHRLIMEKYLHRYLTDKEVVHHINGNKQDNHLKNLQLFPSDSEHTKHEIYLGNIPVDNWRGKKLSEEHRLKVIRTLIHGAHK